VGATTPLSSLPAWADAMQRDGYIVQEGTYGYLGTKECRNMDTCFALNPATPYGLIYLPSHPFESAENMNYTNACVRHNLCKTVGKATWSPMWRIARGESIILTGLTPPNSTYWSFENYLWSRLQPRGFRPKPQDLTHRLLSCPRVPLWSKGKRCDLFAGINDPLNFQTVNASSPFNSSIILVISWDTDAEAAASQYLAHHLPANAGTINYLRNPGAILKLGVTRGDEDEFFNMLRVEGIKDQAARKAFYKQVPLRAFRVTPTVQIPTPSDTALWPSFDGHLRTRWTGHSESAPGVTTEALQDGVRQLRKAVQKKHSRSFFDHTSLAFKAWVNDSGYECITRGIRCQGDCRDTVYAYATLVDQDVVCNVTHIPCKPARKSELTRHPSDAIYVFGVNHQRTGHAIYSSLTLYDFPRLASGSIRIMGQEKEQFVIRDVDYADSAQGLLPKHPAAPFLYAVKYARKCQAKEEVLCVEVPIESHDPEAILMPIDAKLAFVERMYLKPGMKTGPALAETVLPSMLHIRRIFEDSIIV